MSLEGAISVSEPLEYCFLKSLSAFILILLFKSFTPLGIIYLSIVTLCVTQYVAFFFSLKTTKPWRKLSEANGCKFFHQKQVKGSTDVSIHEKITSWLVTVTGLEQCSSAFRCAERSCRCLPGLVGTDKYQHPSLHRQRPSAHLCVKV